MSKNHYPCVFSHLILSGRCGCEFASKNCVAEKEFGTCADKKAAEDCHLLYHELRHNSSFVLASHTPQKQANLSVGQQSKIKMGGLLGLQEILTGLTNHNITNIYLLIQNVKNQYQDFKHIPFSQLMPKIAKFKFRQKPP